MTHPLITLEAEASDRVGRFGFYGCQPHYSQRSRGLVHLWQGEMQEMQCIEGFDSQAVHKCS